MEFYEELGKPHKVITAEQIAKEALMFAIEGTNQYGGRRYLRVAVRSWAYGGGTRMVGWVAAPGQAPAASSLPTLTIPAPGPTPASTPASSQNLSVTGPSADAQMSGKFDGFDRATRVLVLRDLVGAAFEFVLRDDTMLTTSAGARRLDEHLESNFNNHPWSQGQTLSIVWKPSADGTRRIAVSIR